VLALNPGFKFFLAVIVSLEISLTTSLPTNLIIIGVAVVYLLFNHVKIKNLLLTLLLPLVATTTIFATLYWFKPEPNLQNALCLASRIYVYTLTIYCVFIGTTTTEFARCFEQNFHLPSKFAYGILAALNLVPQMKQAIKKVQTAAMMRGVYLSFWSPTLYFKAILIALNSAENLAQAMESHGYVEDEPRTTIVAIPIKISDWIYSGIILLFVNLALLTFN
jgi:energy-coupling factor transport system permease protein